MLDRALSTTFRNLSTLFLLGAVLFVPLHLAHAFAFRNVLSVAELRADIAEFPEGKKVRNVGVAELGNERSTLLVLLLVEAGLAVLLVGAARKVIELDAGGEVPTVVDAYRDAIPSLKKVHLGAGALGPLLVCALVGVIAAWLTYEIGLVMAELLGEDKAYAGVGMTRGVALALFATFLIGPAAALSSQQPQIERDVPLDVY